MAPPVPHRSVGSRPSLAALGVAVFVTAPAFGQLLDNIGYTALEAELGAATPDGSGVPVLQVEAKVEGSDNYFPDINQSDFAGINFTDLSGTQPAGQSSFHATAVGRGLYGVDAAASGIDSVLVQELNDWLNNAINRDSNDLPTSSPARIQNHSWIASFTLNSDNEDVLRRVDYMIDQGKVLASVGVNNGSTTSLPPVLAQAYNVISVGLSDGNHSSGTTSVDGSGRIKPEIVSSSSFTSFATAHVAGSAAILFETAANLADPETARDPRVLKAMLMAGATKEEFGADWERTPTQPLDLVYGAGELNIYNSYFMMVGANRTPGSTGAMANDASGWASDRVNGGETDVYYFSVAQGKLLEDVSIVTTWHRTVTFETLSIGVGRFKTEFLQANSDPLANLSLTLYATEGATLQGATVIDSSESSEHNVEHIWQPDALPPGDYAIAVSNEAGGADTPYGLAWRAVERDPINLAEWNVAWFTGSGVSEADQAFAADADADGKPNGVEYATGCNPLVPDGPAVIADGSPSAPGFSYVVDTEATDVTVTPGFSANLSGIDETGAGISLVGTEDLGDGLQRRHYAFTPVGTRGFGLIRVEPN